MFDTDKIKVFGNLNSAANEIKKNSEEWRNMYECGELRLREDEISTVIKTVKDITIETNRILEVMSDFKKITNKVIAKDDEK